MRLAPLLACILGSPACSRDEPAGSGDAAAPVVAPALARAKQAVGGFGAVEESAASPEALALARRVRPDPAGRDFPRVRAVRHQPAFAFEPPAVRPWCPGHSSADALALFLPARLSEFPL